VESARVALDWVLFGSSGTVTVLLMASLFQGDQYPAVDRIAGGTVDDDTVDRGRVRGYLTGVQPSGNIAHSPPAQQLSLTSSWAQNGLACASLVS
jgi:hypothetical protein